MAAGKGTRLRPLTEFVPKPMVPVVNKPTVQHILELVQRHGINEVVMTLAFLVLATTGAILYITPQGRVANRTGWNVLRLSKKRWVSVHTTASLLFFIASGFHVYFNWRTLVRYLLLKRRLHP